MEKANDTPRVANPPPRPLMAFDGDCGFCRYWVDRWRHATGGNVDYEPYQKEAVRFPEIPPEAFARAIQFIEADGSVTSGADAVFRALEYAPQKNELVEGLKKVPGFLPAARIVYGIVAANRPFFSWLTRIFFQR